MLDGSGSRAAWRIERARRPFPDAGVQGRAAGRVEHDHPKEALRVLGHRVTIGSERWLPLAAQVDPLAVLAAGLPEHVVLPDVVLHVHVDDLSRGKAAGKLQGLAHRLIRPVTAHTQVDDVDPVAPAPKSLLEQCGHGLVVVDLQGGGRAVPQKVDIPVACRQGPLRRVHAISESVEMDPAVEGAVGEVSRCIGDVGPAERRIASPEQVLGRPFRVRGGPAQLAPENHSKRALAQHEGEGREQRGEEQGKEDRVALACRRDLLPRLRGA